MLRSVVFTALLDLSPAFGRLEMTAGEAVVTRAVEALPVPSLNVYADVRAWLEQNPLE